MVKKKSGRTLNPADAHRKAMRQKEIKKNKAERKRVRTFVMMHKDTSKLEEEIARYRSLDKEKRLDKNGKIKLKDLEDKLSKIVETKKAHGVSITKDKPKEPTPVLHQPILNPSDSDESTDDDSSENDENSEVDDIEKDEDTDEDIPLPHGLPPKKINETSDNNSENDDELPELPPGPPPSKKQSEIIDGEKDGDESENVEEEEEEEDDDDLPALPPGPPPSMMKKQQKTIAKLPPPPPPPPSSFGFYHFNHHHGHPPRPPVPPPPFLLPANPFMMYNGPPPGSPNNQRPNMRPPPPPPPQNSFPPRTGPNHFGRPPPPPPPKNITSLPSSSITATPVIQAEPQVRNLQKELTTLVPLTLLRRKAASNKPKVTRPLVNTAPNIDDGLVSETSSASASASASSLTIPIKRPSSPTLVATNMPLLQNQSSNDKQQKTQSLPKKSKTRKKVDEYEKFMAEMQDLL